MKRNTSFRLAASGLIVAFGLAAPSGDLTANGGDPGADPARAARSAERASDALQAKRYDRAVRAAEDAVGMDLHNPSYRVLLGQAYLANGRFASAEESFATARELGADAPRAIIGHALSLIAVGRAADALDLIESGADVLPASDFGLALALAGQPERAVMVLSDIVRSGESTARDRQNLALAYGFAGRWLEARLIAAQDVGPARAAQRIEQWTRMAQASDPRQRVAGLIGSQVPNDAGMPVRLALRDAAPAPMLAASDDPAPLGLYAPPPPTDSAALVDELLAAAEPANTEPAPLAASARVAESSAPVAAPAAALPAPVRMADGREIIFVSNPVIQPLRSMIAMVAPLAAPAPATRPSTPAAHRAPSGDVRTSGWAVQLGAYDSVGVARDGWSRLSRRHAARLSGHDAVTTSASVGGRTVYRLAVTGYDSRAQANTACAAIARAGSACFVRQIASSESVRWTSRQTATRVAIR